MRGLTAGGQVGDFGFSLVFRLRYEQRAPKPPVSKAVFINCPLDDGFKKILRAMVFTIISSGYHPHCALDATNGAEIAVSKIATMIGECDWRIRDLSTIEIDATGMPRFSMPMELGVYLGARLLSRRIAGLEHQAPRVSANQ